MDTNTEIWEENRKKYNAAYFRSLNELHITQYVPNSNNKKMKVTNYIYYKLPNLDRKNLNYLIDNNAIGKLFNLMKDNGIQYHKVEKVVSALPGDFK